MKIKSIPVSFFSEVASTNETIKDLAVPHFAIAEKQSGGRGRGGKSFLSEKGGLYMSYSFRPKLTQDKTGLYSIAAGIAVSEVTRGQVKWPNDVFLNNKKITGILSEYGINDGGARIIIGIGVNINNTNFENIPNATSLKVESGRNYDINKMLKSVGTRLIKIINKIESGSDIIKMYNKHALLNNKSVTVKELSGVAEYNAKCLGIDKQGLLEIITEDGQKKKLAAAEVSILLQNRVL